MPSVPIRGSARLGTHSYASVAVLSIPKGLDEYLSVGYFWPDRRERGAFRDALVMKKQLSTSLFGKRVLDLRKVRRWSQPELAAMIGTSGAIIGRYERGEMTPSIDVARKLADAFGVTLDYLVSEEELPAALKDKEMLERWRAIDGLPAEDRDRILFVVDGLIRDAKARKAYSTSP
jgi:transcriptional regulator with XRE-family HTH domain